jgi:hypothetical protein
MLESLASITRFALNPDSLSSKYIRLGSLVIEPPENTNVDNVRSFNLFKESIYIFAKDDRKILMVNS